MSRIIVDAVRNSSASSDGITLASDGSVTLPGNATCSGTATGFGGGKLLQVVSTTKTDTASTSTSGSFTDVSGMSVSITPSSTSSKIFIIISLGTVSSAQGIAVAFKLLRGSTAVGNTAGSDAYAGFSSFYGGGGTGDEYMLSGSHNFLDSPSTTSSTTYKLQWRNSGGTSYLGRYHGSVLYQGSSTITAMEIAA